MRTFIQHCLQLKTVNNSNVHQKQNGPNVNSYNGITYAGFLPFAPQISLFTKQREWMASSISVKGLFLKKWDTLILWDWRESEKLDVEIAIYLMIGFYSTL